MLEIVGVSASVFGGFIGHATMKSNPKKGAIVGAVLGLILGCVGYIAYSQVKVSTAINNTSKALNDLANMPPTTPTE